MARCGYLATLISLSIGAENSDLRNKKKHSHSEPENENEIKNRGLTKNISLHILNIKVLLKG